MHDYKKLKPVTLILSRLAVCSLLNALDAQVENNAEESEVYRAIRCSIRVQLADHDAKEASKHDS